MTQETTEAIRTTDDLLSLLDEAERQFKSSRNWSFIDLLGGGIIVDLIKHYKLNKAGNIMQEVNYLLQKLNQQTKLITIPGDYSMHTNEFLTFADFAFDGFLVDAYMAGKIISSIDEIKRLKERLVELRRRLSAI